MSTVKTHDECKSSRISALVTGSLVTTSILGLCTTTGFVIDNPKFAVAATPTETALVSDKFVDSIGVNTHLRYLNTAYANYATIIKPLLIQLGVRHIRDTVLLSEVTIQAEFNDLASSGIKTDLIVDPRWIPSLSNVPQIVSKIQASVESIESANEWDIAGSTTLFNGQPFPLGLINFHNQLYLTLKNSPITSSLPVLAPSMAYWTNASSVGALPSDYGNMHSYSGTADATGGALSSQITAAQTIAPNQPVISSETGWQNATGDQYSISQTASAKYLTRLFPEYMNRNVVRAYPYEFINEFADSKPESNFGLLNYNGTPKPAFTALKNMIALLKDPGSTFTPGSLSYSLGSVPSTIHHTLLQKRSGTFYLLLWQEISSYDATKKQDIVNPAITLTMTLGTAIKQANLYLPLNSSTATATYSNPSKLTLSVPDHLLIVELVK